MPGKAGAPVITREMQDGFGHLGGETRVLADSVIAPALVGHVFSSFTSAYCGPEIQGNHCLVLNLRKSIGIKYRR